jgi:hypothetical protein
MLDSKTAAATTGKENTQGKKQRWTKRINSLDLANNELQKVETQKIYVFFETETR